MELDATKATEAEKVETVEATNWDDLGVDEIETEEKEEPIGRKPTLIRIESDILLDGRNSPVGHDVDIKAGTEVSRFAVDEDGDIWIATDSDNLESFDLMLEEDEYEVLKFEGDDDQAADQQAEPQAVEPEHPPTVQQQLDASEEWQQAVREARGAVRVREAEFEAAREEARRAKKDWEAAMKELCDVIDGEPGKYPLFDGAKPVAAEKEIDQAAVDAAIVGTQTEAAAEDESWKAVPLAELIQFGLSQGIVDILAGNPEMAITTVGDITAWTERMKDYDSPLTKIPKIGKGKGEKIEEALLKFFAARKPQS